MPRVQGDRPGLHTLVALPKVGEVEASPAVPIHRILCQRGIVLVLDLRRCLEDGDVPCGICRRCSCARFAASQSVWPSRPAAAMRAAASTAATNASHGSSTNRHWFHHGGDPSMLWYFSVWPRTNSRLFRTNSTLVIKLDGFFADSGRQRCRPRRRAEDGLLSPKELARRQAVALQRFNDDRLRAE